MRNLALLLLSMCACGGGSQGVADAGADASYGHESFDAAVQEEAGPPPIDCDAGSTPSTTYPAPHPQMPLAATSGGPVMKNPRFVPIVFSAEDRTADIGAFMKAIAGSTYWTSIATQYGVGKPSAVDPIVVNETPAAKITDAEIVTWLQGKLDGTHADFGAADPDSIYVVYYPETTTIEQSSLGDSCLAFGGYHYEAMVGATRIVYAVIARCKGEAMSSITAHELFEAATDPYYGSAPAWQNPEEIGDLCESHVDVVPSDVGYPVPPIWSNAASAAGHDPCQPSSGPYFRTVTASSYVTLPPGQTTTIDLVAYSDADTGGPWTIKVIGSWGQLNDKMTLSLCRNTARNGEHIPLVVSRPADAVNDETIQIQSTLGAVTTYWSVSVGGQ